MDHIHLCSFFGAKRKGQSARVVSQKSVTGSETLCPQRETLGGSFARISEYGVHTHKLDLFPGIEVLDELRLEFPGVVEIAPPEVVSHARGGKLLDHFPRIGLYILLDADMALYITERYEEREYQGKLVARKDIMVLSETVPADLAVTVIDKDPYHRRTRDNFEIGIYGRLPFELKFGPFTLRSEFSVGYDDHAEFMALLRIHLGEQ